MDRRELSKINSANASRRGRNTFWTLGRIERLRHRAEEGLFASAIALELGCSKNSIISKARSRKIKLTGYADYLAAVRRRVALDNAAAIKARIFALQARLAEEQSTEPQAFGEFLFGPPRDPFLELGDELRRRLGAEPGKRPLAPVPRLKTPRGKKLKKRGR